MLYGRIIDGKVAIVQSEASFLDTDHTVQNLWIPVPDALATATLPAPWDGSKGPNRSISTAIFLMRLPQRRRARLTARAASDADLAAALAAWDMAGTVDLDAAATVASMATFVAADHITAAESASMLA